MAGLNLTVTLVGGVQFPLQAEMQDTDAARLVAGMARYFNKPDSDAQELCGKAWEEFSVTWQNRVKGYEQADAAQAAAAQIDLIPVTIS